MTPFIYKTFQTKLVLNRTKTKDPNNRSPNDQLFERSIFRLSALSEIRMFGFRHSTVRNFFFSDRKSGDEDKNSEDVVKTMQFEFLDKVRLEKAAQDIDSSKG